MKQEHFLADEETAQAVCTICQRYKISRRADAIRFAILTLANSPRLALQPPEPQRAGRKPKAKRAEEQ